MFDEFAGPRFFVRLASQEMHTRTLAKHSALTPELEAQAHELGAEQQAGQAKRRKKDGPRMPCPACAADLAACA